MNKVKSTFKRIGYHDENCPTQCPQKPLSYKRPEDHHPGHFSLQNKDLPIFHP